MAGHTEQLVGTLFRVLSEEGHTDAREALLRSYDSAATAEREQLTRDLFSDLLDVLHERIDDQQEIEVLTTAVEQLLDRFTAVIEAAPVAILVIDETGAIEVWNDGAERMFGWTDADIRRRSYPQALTESPDVTGEFLRRLRRGERLHGVEAQHSTKDGGVLDVRVWGAPIHTRDDEFGGGIFVISDITAQKQREQRLAVLNRVLRHNIRNDVSIIQGHLDMLAEYDDDAADGITDHLEVMDEHLSNVVELSETARRIEQLQTRRESELTTVHLGEVLRERIERLRAQFRQGEIAADVAEPTPVVAHELLPYAFDNLLYNAIEHNDSAVPRVMVATEQSERQVTVRIRDNGPGLPPTEQRVLTSETETPLEHSSGMGLWLARWVVRSSNGTISAGTSDLGGARIEIRLRTGSEGTNDLPHPSD